MLEIIYFLLGCVLCWFIINEYEKYKDHKQANTELTAAVMKSMAFLQVESIDTNDEKIYLAYNARSCEFLGQAGDTNKLMKNIFSRFPQYEMLWIQQKNQWVAITKQELDEKSI